METARRFTPTILPPLIAMTRAIQAVRMWRGVFMVLFVEGLGKGASRSHGARGTRAWMRKNFFGLPGQVIVRVVVVPASGANVPSDECAHQSSIPRSSEK